MIVQKGLIIQVKGSDHPTMAAVSEETANRVFDEYVAREYETIEFEHELGKISIEISSVSAIAIIPAEMLPK